MTRKLFWMLLSALVVLSTGCSSKLTKESETNYAIRDAEIQTKTREADQYERKRGINRERLYLGSRIVEVKERTPLPPAFDKDVLFSSLDPVSLSEIIKFIATHYHTRIHVTQDALSHFGSDGESQSNSGAGDSTAGSGSGNENPLDTYRIPLTYDGKLKGFFDTITSRSNTFWRYEDNHAVIFRHETKTYTVKAFAGTNTTNNQFVGSILSAGDSENETQLAAGTNATDVSIWQEIENDLRAKTSPDGRIAIQQSTGRVTVTDTPFVIKQVDDYVRSLNADLEQQISIQIHVYQLDRNDSNDYGIDWNLVFTDNDTNFNLIPGLFGAGINSSADLNVVDTGSHFNTSRLLLRSLSQYGKLSEVTTHRSLSLNGQTVPVKNQTQRSFIESASLTTTDSGQTTSLTPGTVSEGIAINVTPRVVNGREIMLQMGITLSTIDAIDEITSGETTLQIPTVSSKSTLQRVSLRSGHSLVISGLERSIDNSEYSGIGKRYTQALGGRQQTRVRRSTTIIVITPRIVEI